MGPDRDRACDPWICSQTRICSQTCYRLRYAARHTIYMKLVKGLLNLEESEINLAAKPCLSLSLQFYKRLISCLKSLNSKSEVLLNLFPPFLAKVVCFSHLLKCLRSLYGKSVDPDWIALIGAVCSGSILNSSVI